MGKRSVLAYLLAGCAGGILVEMVQWVQPAYATRFTKEVPDQMVSSGFVLSDQRGKHLAELKIGPDGNPVFYMHGKDSQSGAVMFFHNGGPAFQLEDSNGIARVAISLGDTLKGPTIVVCDAKGRIRASLGKMSVIEDSKTELSNEASVFLLNEDQTVIWQAPPKYELHGRPLIVK